MQNHPKSQNAFPRWLGYCLIAILVVFFGIGLKTVFAAFNDPTCDPLTSPGTCNTKPPIFTQTDPAGAIQTIETPLTIGATGGISEDLNLYGSIILNENGQNLRTNGYASGTVAPINVSNSGSFYTIVSNASEATGAAYSASASGYATGLLANSINGTALYAITTGEGYGLRIDYSGTTTALKINASGKQAMNITGDSILTGNANITGALTVGSITVGGQSLTGNEKTLTGVIPSATLPAYGELVIPLKSVAFNNSNYRLTSLQILYSKTATPPANTYWYQFPVDSTKLKYQECNNTGLGTFVGNLTLTNPLSDATNVRVKLTYSTDAVNCASDNSAPLAPIISVTPTPYANGGKNYVKGLPTLNVTASDPESDITEVTIYANAVLVATCSMSPCSYTYASVPTTKQTITATAKSGAAEISPTATYIFSPDNYGPIITAFSAPAATVSSQTNISVQISENLSGVKMESGKYTGVRLYLCPGATCTVGAGTELKDFTTNDFAQSTDDTYWKINWNTTAFVNGTYTILATAVDNVGNIATVPPSIVNSKTIAISNVPICGIAGACYTIPNSTEHKTSCCTNTCYDPIVKGCCAGATYDLSSECCYSNVVHPIAYCSCPGC
ncbi:MAG: Ig-like domain-containing protein [Patescibacteria group bacterium]|jgi:hypothetical protein